MNMWNMMKWAWAISWLREKLIAAWVNPQELQWYDFSNPDSLNKLAQKIVPNLLKNNPDIAQKIKTSWMLDEEVKRDVVEIIDSI